MSGRGFVLAATISALALHAGSTLGMIETSRATVRSWPKLLLWNASASAPRGLYLLRSPEPLHTGELVVAVPPPWLAQFSGERDYLPLGLPLLKHIAALPPQTVCRTGTVVSIDHRAVAAARLKDRSGRTLPSWARCRTLRTGEVFLLNAAVQESFDGRYFGLLSTSAITARAIPLWTEHRHEDAAASQPSAAAWLFGEPHASVQSHEGKPVRGASGISPSAAVKPGSAHRTVRPANPLASAASGPAAAQTHSPYDGFVREAARRFDLPVSWIAAVMQAESDGKPQAISPKGAMGLMQIMPSTWTELRDRYQLGDDPFDPQNNILAGAGYLRELFDRFGSGNFLAAYHAGPARVEAVLNRRAALGPDTRKYLRRLAALLSNSSLKLVPETVGAEAHWRVSQLFVTAPGSASNAAEQQNGGNNFPLAPRAVSLFVAVRGAQPR